MVPFGGGDHDWAALELARLDRVRDRGAAEAHRRRATATAAATRAAVLDSASLVVQQLAGIETEPVLVDLANGGIVPATEGAGLLVVGLSERWRTKGSARSARRSPKAAPAPILFVRRGTRAGRACAAHRRRHEVRLVTRRTEPG